MSCFFFFQAEDGIRDYKVTGVQTCALPILVADGVAATEIAVLVRTNAQVVPFEGALTAADIPFTVRGVRFFARPDVRAARAALRTDATGRLSRIVAERWRTELGFDESAPVGPGIEARDRHAALATLLAMARRLE